jgi:hypothetical protein
MPPRPNATGKHDAVCRCPLNVHHMIRLMTGSIVLADTGYTIW